MSKIKTSELNSSGVSLFNDSESYLTELDNSALAEVNGGFFTIYVNLATRTVRYTRR